MSATDRQPSFGSMLRSWRNRRRFTQLSLALDAEVSARHVSYLETGRARPSRQMVLILASALSLPLEERNALLLAAGYAPAYRAQGLAGDEAALVQRALRFLLVQHQPYPAFVVDPSWQIVLANDAFQHFASWLGGEGRAPEAHAERIIESPPIVGSNPLIQLFDPQGWRPMVENFETIAPVMMGHVRSASRDSPAAGQTLRILEALSPDLRPAHHEGVLPLVIPLNLMPRSGQRLSLFSTMTMVGTATDVVISTLRLETYFPADETTAEALRSIASSSSEPLSLRGSRPPG